MTSVRRIGSFLCAAMCLWGWSSQVMAQGTSTPRLRIVGGLADGNQYREHELPFWTQELPRLSGGKFDADIVPFDRSGVPGEDMLRLIRLGVIPFGTALLASVVGQYPQYGAADLAGLNPDMASLKRNLAAFRPYLEKEMRDRHGAELLAIYVYPAQVIFCKRPLASLTDLAGRRVRVSSPTQSDFVTALSGVPVLTGFSGIMPAMASGSTECAITGGMSGNTLGLHEVTSHVHAIPITWGLAIFAANQAAWNALQPEVRALLTRELPKLEARIWADSERKTAEGMACNRGDASCNSGHRGKMTVIPISAQDEQRRQDIFRSAVMPNWLKRCNAPCAEIWNQTIGPVRGIVAPLAR
jgi:TRAP-type C4-dicarboxylate transport system substrate-binding protein